MAEQAQSTYTREEAAAAAIIASQLRQNEQVRQDAHHVALQMVRDPLIWLQQHTQTKDNHWREAGATSPYRAFPNKPYFRPIMDRFFSERVLFIEKSRDMMLSWFTVALFTHQAMTNEGIEVIFQSQKETKAFELVDYAQTLYDRQHPDISRYFPLAKGRQSAGKMVFAHGGRIIGLAGGADQIRSYHPWGLLMDESAFMPESGSSYNHAVSVCQKIVALSSAGPGWFQMVCQSAK